MANTFKKLTALLIIATTITGCGSGQNAATRTIKQVTDGVEAESAGIKLRNVLIVKTATAEGVLVATVINTSDETDSIVGVAIGGAMTNLVAKSNELKKNKPIIFVGDSANADASIPVLNTSAGERIDITFTFAKTASDQITFLVSPFGLIRGSQTGTAYASVAAVREASMMIAVDIWQARQAPSGQGVGIDNFQPSPFKMGNTLVARVRGLLAPYLAPQSMVG